MKAAVYARVSTREQDTDMQLQELRRYAEARGYAIFREYVDQGISGAKAHRPALDALMQDAMKKRFQVVIVWKFDRFARSLKHLVSSLEFFNNLGIDFVSIKEDVDTTTPAGKLLFHIIGAMAEFERDLIAERVRSGMQAAKRRGVKVGRPRVNVAPVEVENLRRRGMSYPQIAKRLGISVGTAYNLFKKASGEA